MSTNEIKNAWEQKARDAIREGKSLTAFVLPYSTDGRKMAYSAYMKMIRATANQMS